MERLFTILTLSLGFICAAHAQTVIVNPDGTHSIVISSGNTSTVVNSDGTHSTVINNGSTSTIVNSNGTHSTMINNGNTSTIVNPDGSHSTVINSGNTSIIVNPDGSHSTVIKNRKRSTTVNQHPIVTKNDVTTLSADTVKTDSAQVNIADSVKTVNPPCKKNKKIERFPGTI